MDGKWKEKKWKNENMLTFNRLIASAWLLSSTAFNNILNGSRFDKAFNFFVVDITIFPTQAHRAQLNKKKYAFIFQKQHFTITYSLQPTGDL